MMPVLTRMKNRDTIVWKLMKIIYTNYRTPTELISKKGVSGSAFIAQPRRQSLLFYAARF
jgi:hypothetical protein